MDDKNKKELFEDLCNDAASPTFREEMLGTMLRQARRKKQMRHVRGGAMVMALVAVVVLLNLPRKEAVPLQPLVREPRWFVRSQPLENDAIVHTGAALPLIVTSKSNHAVIVHTARPEDTFVVINDKQLFKLLDGAPAALVGEGDKVELVFVNPSDAEKFVASIPRR